MNTNELTAKYICEDKDRLQMALHVHQAMPTVREHLIEDVFKAVGEHIAKQIDGVKWRSDAESVYFWTEDTGEFGVSAWVSHGKGDILRLVAGVYVDDAKSVNKTRRDEIQACFDSIRETWSYGDRSSSNTEIAYANVHYDHGGGRWDEDDFLTRAILNRDEIVSPIAELLVGIYTDCKSLFG